jgi:hypothetical protein
MMKHQTRRKKKKKRNRKRRGVRWPGWSGEGTKGNEAKMMEILKYSYISRSLSWDCFFTLIHSFLSSRHPITPLCNSSMNLFKAWPFTTMLSFNFHVNVLTSFLWFILGVSIHSFISRSICN